MRNDNNSYIGSNHTAGNNMIDVYKRQTVHAEACEDLERTIEQIREAGVKVGVSIKPATPVNDISHMLSDVDMVLSKTVQPGFGGQKYMEECTEKIREVRELIEAEDLDVDVQVDGGINDETMETVDVYKRQEHSRSRR